MPFELGRPFGTPGEPDFQRRVLQSVLALLKRDDGPVILEDFPDDAPGQGEASMEGMVCPVRLRRPERGHQSDLVRQVMSEMAELAPWRELFVASHGRSIVGASRMPIDDAVTALGAILESGQAEGIGNDELGVCLRYASEDLRNWLHRGGFGPPRRRSFTTATRGLVLG